MTSAGIQSPRWIHYDFETLYDDYYYYDEDWYDEEEEYDYYWWWEDEEKRSWIRHNIEFTTEFRSELLNAASNSTASPPKFPLLCWWLKDCDKNHGECHQQPQREYFWPKRVIFVGNPSNLILVEKPVQGEDYLVLSHCWGPLTDQDKTQFCTTSENYEARTRGFSFNELPKTFQDAVLVTQALQKQYLWIDALCIIQGPDGDWESEAKTMADIFASAYCTIAASSAHGWRDGFLKLQSNSPDIREQSTSDTSVCRCDFNKDVDEGALMNRAWVLQERVLSRRIIHFTATHTYCECGKGVLCEQLTTLTPPFGKEYFILDPNFPQRLRKSGIQRTIDFLQFLFRKYSTSGLTVITDRDYAIHSLAERMEETLRNEVRYGIFRSLFGSLLLWRRTCKIKTARIPYRGRTIPSWSWMAYSGGIDFIATVRQSLKVPRKVDFDFTEDGEALKVQVRKFGGNCRLEDKGEEHGIVARTEQVGSLWLDIADQTRLEDCSCVVVSMAEEDEVEDARKTYYVLVIREKASGGGYERLGAGKVEAQYVSRDCIVGTLW